MTGHVPASDPLTRFEDEHHHALGELERLERAAEGLEDGEDPTEHLETMRQVHTFLSTAVREHNENEERALFPLLGDEAPTGVFEEEHVRLRTLEHELSEALDGPHPTASAPMVALALVDLLRGHIDRENHVLFPMARGLLGPEGLARVERILST
jgi:hemerythrin-like domain-containing protein